MTAVDVVFALFMLSIFELFVILSYLSGAERDYDIGLEFFDPVCNYRAWKSMNWFGVIFFTLLWNIIFPVFSLIYWFYKLCTIGRK